MPYREDPFGQVIACHFEDEDEPPEPPPPKDHLCGSYENHNGTITWSRFNYTTQQNETVTMGPEEAAAYALAYYTLTDPPGYPHDELNHTFNGFILGPAGINWNTPGQPPNAFNVLMQLASRFKITIHQSIASSWVDTRQPGDYGYYLTYTNILDPSTWVWVPNTPYPIYIDFPAYPHGIGYSNLAFAGDSQNRMPPVPPTWQFPTGSHAATGSTTNFEYEYISLPPDWVQGAPIPTTTPFDPSQGGNGAFWYMSTEGLTAIQNPLYPNNPPPGEGQIWVSNVPNTITGSEYYIRIDGYCLEYHSPFPP